MQPQKSCSCVEYISWNHNIEPGSAKSKWNDGELYFGQIFEFRLERRLFAFALLTRPIILLLQASTMHLICESNRRQARGLKPKLELRATKGCRGWCFYLSPESRAISRKGGVKINAVDYGLKSYTLAAVETARSWKSTANTPWKQFSKRLKFPIARHLYCTYLSSCCCATLYVVLFLVF